MRVGKFKIRDLARQLDWFVLIELRGERVMCKNASRHQRGHGDNGTYVSNSHLRYFPFFC
jgi:hypothetical protein